MNSDTTAARTADATVATHATGRIADVSPRQLARIGGALYLINIVTGAFAIGYVTAALVVPGDAAATAHNLQAHELLYRWGIVTHIITLLTNVPLAVIFYDLLKVVSRRGAMLVVFFTLLATAIEGANLLSQFAPLTLLGGRHYLNVFTPEQLQALAYIPLDSQGISFSIQQVFFVGYLLCASYLIVRSSFLPRAIGMLLAIGGLCYLTYSFAVILSPAFAAHLVPYIQVPSGIAELSFALWLLVVGVNEQRWKEQASQHIS